MTVAWNGIKEVRSQLLVQLKSIQIPYAFVAISIYDTNFSLKISTPFIQSVTEYLYYHRANKIFRFIRLKTHNQFPASK